MFFPSKNRRKSSGHALVVEQLETKRLLAVVALGVPIVDATVSGDEVVAVGHQQNGSTGVVQGKRVTLDLNGLNSLQTVTLGNQYGGDVKITGLSRNEVYVSGYLDEFPARGLVWNAGDITTAIDVGSIANAINPSTETAAFDVSNNGIATGTTGGALIGFRWDETNGITALAGTTQGALGRGITSDGSTVVGFSVDGVTDPITPTLWSSGGRTILDLGTAVSGAATDPSDDGAFIVGFVDFFDITTLDLAQQFSFWKDTVLTQVTNPDGTPFVGEPIAVSATLEFAGGRSPDSGFIYHANFGAQDFDTWLFNHDGQSLPGTSTSVVSINPHLASNGQEQLVIVANDVTQGYVITTPAPFPLGLGGGNPPSFAWHNVDMPFDVNANGVFGAGDPSVIGRYLRQYGEVELIVSAVPLPSAGGHFVDVNMDGWLTNDDFVDATVAWASAQLTAFQGVPANPAALIFANFANARGNNARFNEEVPRNLANNIRWLRRAEPEAFDQLEDRLADELQLELKFQQNGRVFLREIRPQPTAAVAAVFANQNPLDTFNIDEDLFGLFEAADLD